MFFVACWPSCIAAGATPGTNSPSCFRLARSPITNASGWPGRDRSGLTRTRFARSSGTPSDRPNREPVTPAAHSTVRAATRSSPSDTP